MANGLQIGDKPLQPSDSATATEALKARLDAANTQLNISKIERDIQTARDKGQSQLLGLLERRLLGQQSLQDKQQAEQESSRQAVEKEQAQQKPLLQEQRVGPQNNTPQTFEDTLQAINQGVAGGQTVGAQGGPQPAAAQAGGSQIPDSNAPQFLVDQQTRQRGPKPTNIGGGIILPLAQPTETTTNIRQNPNASISQAQVQQLRLQEQQLVFNQVDELVTDRGATPEQALSAVQSLRNGDSAGYANSLAGTQSISVQQKRSAIQANNAQTAAAFARIDATKLDQRIKTYQLLMQATAAGQESIYSATGSGRSKRPDVSTLLSRGQNAGLYNADGAIPNRGLFDSFATQFVVDGGQVLVTEQATLWGDDKIARSVPTDRVHTALTAITTLDEIDQGTIDKFNKLTGGGIKLNAFKDANGNTIIRPLVDPDNPDWAQWQTILDGHRKLVKYQNEQPNLFAQFFPELIPKASNIPGVQQEPNDIFKIDPAKLSEVLQSQAQQRPQQPEGRERFKTQSPFGGIGGAKGVDLKTLFQKE